MLYYEDLSAGQKRWVELVQLHYSELLASQDNILSYENLKEIDTFFRSKREEHKSYKISKPLWLITNNALERGMYKFPFDGAEEEPETPVTSQEAAYIEELKSLGIKPKK